jgi:hypothetical protein
MTTCGPVDTEHFFSHLFGNPEMHGLAGALQQDSVWRKYLGRAMKHLRRYVEVNLPFTDSRHREDVTGLLMALEEQARMKPSLLREQALVSSLIELCLCLLGDRPDQWDRRRVAHPQHFALNRHRTLSYAQSVDQRARLIADACLKAQGSIGMTESEAKAARERYWRLIYPKQLPDEFIDWFRTAHPEPYIRLFA